MEDEFIDYASSISVVKNIIRIRDQTYFQLESCESIVHC
jgi:hypothetical protein